MKIGVIGAGAVGAACVFSLVMRNVASEIVLLDTNKVRAKGTMTDMQYGACLSTSAKLVAGEYSDLKDSSVILITAGMNEKSGGATNRDDPAGRLKLLDANVKIYQDIIPQIQSVAPESILVVVTDPPDPLADVARQLIGHDKVISTGTYLDSLRFAFHLSQALNVSPLSIAAQVIGEHGTSEVFLWSQANVGNIKVMDAIKKLGIKSATFQQDIENAVRFANITIIEGINASQYGIGMIAAKITEMILRNTKSVIPVGSYQPEYGVTLSLPSILGNQGVTQAFKPTMSSHEEEAFEKCVETLKMAAKIVKL